MPIFRALRQQLAQLEVEACKQVILACAVFSWLLRLLRNLAWPHHIFLKIRPFAIKYA
jgi:hypothetical protein